MKTKLPSFTDNAGVNLELMFCVSRARALPVCFSFQAMLMRCIEGS